MGGAAVGGAAVGALLHAEAEIIKSNAAITETM
jgi:hypothetical protein